MRTPALPWVQRCLAGALVFSGSVHAAAKQAAEDATIEIPNPAYLSLLLARDPAVHAELALTPAQLKSVAAAVAEVDHPLWVLRDVPVARCSVKLDELRAQLRARLEATLSAEQAERFDQLVMQARGAKALLAPELRKRLELSDDQIAQLSKFIGEAKDGKLAATQLTGVLSSEQQTALASMFGRRFELARVTQVGCAAPELRAVDEWINSGPLSLAQLRGKVVVVHFWAFNCGNCVNNLPHYRAWYDKFPAADVTIIGIHTPETVTERSVDNLRANIKQRGIPYPVAVDGAAENWKSWGNNVWPSVYLIDRRGNVRSWWYGELNWQGARGEESMRKRIEELLAEK